MKKIRRIAVIAMIAIVSMGTLSGCGMFRDKVKYSGECGGEGDGSNLTWTLTKSGLLTISGEGRMTDGKLPWNTFYGELHEKVKQVVIEDGITHIGDNAFYSCTTIEGEVILPDTVKTVGDFAFYECSGIQRIELSPNLESIGNYAFRGCSGWAGDLNLPERVTFIGEEAFENCGKLTGELHFSENLTAIGRCAFAHCGSLTGDLILPDSLETLGDYAFSDCGSLNGRLKLSDRLTAIEADAFSYTGLTGDLVIPDSVTRIDENAFSGCRNFDGTLTVGSGVSEIKRYAFYGTNFREITFGDALAFIGYSAFARNPSLTGNLRFPAALRYIGPDAFAGCPNVQGVALQDGVEVIADRAFSGIGQAGDVLELPESIWYTGKGDAAFQDSCFADVRFQGERESDQEYHVQYRGETDPDIRTQDAKEAGDSDGKPGGSDDMAYVWTPEGENLIGCGRFADTWLCFEKGTLQIHRMYRGEEVLLASIPAKYADDDACRFRTEDVFTYKGVVFQEFQFVQWNFSCEVCVAIVRDEDGRGRELLFGDWTDDADGMWDAYLHSDELKNGVR